MDAWTTAHSLLPEKAARALERFPRAEEIRLRLGKAPGVVIAGRETRLCAEPIDRAALTRVLEKATDASLHAAAPALKNGYISYRGLRIGVCGEAVYTGENMSGLRSFSSVAIRIPHDAAADCASMVESLLYPEPASTLIAAPPGVGKTSFLRELIRGAASRSLRVGVADERNELSASSGGRASLDLGEGSDVMVGVPKAKAAMMLLRGMNPQIIAMDEITQEEDLRAVEQIAGCGVLLFATVHGKDEESMRRRPLYRELFSGGVFDELVTIRCLGEKRIYSRSRLSV